MSLDSSRGVHPGEMLREDFLPDYGLDSCVLAARLRIPAEHVKALLAENAPIDADDALRLGRLFDTTPRFWTNLQADADLAGARERLGAELALVRPMSDTGWARGHSTGTEGWAAWLGRTPPSVRLCAALARDAAVALTDPESIAGVSPSRLEDLASGTERFTPADDEALGRALGHSPGYWLRAQAARDTAAGIELSSAGQVVSERIRDALARIEVAEDVRILYAIESGSRAWGFASADSDYDVRFIYAHRPEWYVSVQRRRDVIERPLDHDLDLSGWDLPKALGLFGKSNPPLLEWLNSPRVYLESGTLATRLRERADRYLSPRACLHHYLHMAEANNREYLQGEQVRLKKYFYVLRPVLACRWIEAYGTTPPLEFDVLADDRLPERLTEPVRDLLERKRAGDELSIGPRAPAISEFLDAEIRRLREVTSTSLSAPQPGGDELDALLRATLRETWGI